MLKLVTKRTTQFGAWENFRYPVRFVLWIRSIGRDDPPSFFLRWNFKFDAASGNGNQTPFAVSFARLQLCQVTTRSSNDSLTKRNFRHLGTEGFTGELELSNLWLLHRAIPSRSASFSYLFPLSRSAYLPSPCLPPPLRLVTPILSLSRHSFFPLCFLYLRSFLQTDLIPFEQRCVSNGYSIDTLPFAISRSTKRIRNFGFHSFSFVKSKRS